MISRSCLTLALIFTLLLPNVQAQDRTWTAANGTWNVPGNWSGNAVPTSSGDAYINNSGTARLGVGVSGTASTVFVGATNGGGNYLSVESGTLVDVGAILGNSAGSNGTVGVSSGLWFNTGALIVGGSGTGTLLINGGQVVSAAGLIGNDTAGFGAATVSSGTWNISGPLIVGASGTGSLTLSGGLVTSGTTLVGLGNTSKGTLTLAGGILQTSRVLSGSGANAINFNGGTLQASANSADFISGFTSGVTINSGAAALDTNGFVITSTAAMNGAGQFIKRGAGTLTLTANNTYAGGTVVETGTLVLDGGSLSHSGTSLKVGAAGQNAAFVLQNGGKVTALSASIGDATGSTGSFVISGGTLAVAAGVNIGYQGAGSLTLNGGLISDVNTVIAGNIGVQGSATINSGTWLNSSTTYVGYVGSGTLTVNGGLVASARGAVGGGRGVSTATVNGGTWNIGGGGLTVATSSKVVINGGLVSVGAGVRLGLSTTSSESGFLTVNGGTLTSAGDVNVYGNSIMTVGGGGVVSVGNGSGTLSVSARDGGGSGATLNIGASDLSGTAGTLNVGQVNLLNGFSILSFNQTDAVTWTAAVPGGVGEVLFRGTGTTTLLNTNVQAGFMQVYQGTLEVDGGNAAGGSQFIVGSAGATGTLHLTNNAVFSAGQFYLGGGGTGVAVVDSGTLNAYAINVGNRPGNGSGNGFMTVNGGYINCNGFLGIGTRLGVLTINGGTWNSGAITYIGNGGTGTLNMNGGLFTAGSVGIGPSVSSSGTLNLSGGLFAASQISSGPGSAVFNFNGGTLWATGDNANFVSGFSSGIVINASRAAIDSNGHTIGISSVLTGTGGLSKLGEGTLVLSAANTYTGNTDVTAGTLQVDGSLQSAAVNVTGTSTLSGSGTIAGAVTIASGASLTPGSNGPGTLTTGALTLNDTSILNFELSTPGVVGGGVNDLVSVQGSLVLDGILNIANLSGFGVGTYRLFDYMGSFTDNGLLFGIVPGAFNLTVDTSTANQINLVVTAPAAQYWDGPHTSSQGIAGGTGGSGIWDTATTNWTNANGNANSAWLGATGAVFSGSSGTVTIADGFTATAPSLSFQTDGYVLTASGSGALALTEGGSVEVVTGSATISAPITGTAVLSKMGVGTLKLTGSNSYAGGTTIRAGTLDLSGNGSILHAAADFSVGQYFGDTAALRINGNALISNATGFIGAVAGSSGTVTMSGGTWNNAGELRVGDYGNGTLSITGGSLTSTIGNIGRSFGSTGTVTMSGGKWANSAEFQVGNAGNGMFVLSTGTVSSVLSSIGSGAGATGVAIVNSGAWINSGELRVGDFGNGTLTITGGTLTSTIGNIGRSAGGLGTVTISGGNWMNSAEFLVGNGGVGSFAMSSGTVSSVLSSVGAGSTGTGGATISGGVWLNSGELRVGDFGNGTLTITGGTITSTIGNIGRSLGSSGTVAMSGGSWTNSDQLLVGNAGNGVFTLSSGTVTNNIGTIGAGSGANGVATVSGGRWDNASSLDVGQSGVGTLNLTGTGVVSINAGSGTLTLARNASATGMLNIGTGGLAGTLQAAEVAGGDGAAVVNFDHTGSLSFALRLSGSLAVTKLGTGTLTLTGSNSYAGGTEIQAGTLLLTDVGLGNSVLGTGSVTVDAGGKLGGVGTVLGDTTIAGTLAPGNSPGSMQFAGGLFLDSTAMVQMELASLGSYDQIGVGELLTYGGVLNLTLLGGYFPQIGDTFDLFDAASVAGGSEFDTIAFNFAGYDGTLDYGTGVLTITAVPEPSTPALVALGTGLLAFWRVRRSWRSRSGKTV
ncbi:hypothetical protein BH09VER1_BH09VER1_40860 [soil metagenome]